MSSGEQEQLALRLQTDLLMIVVENKRLAEQVSTAEMALFARHIQQAKSVFVTGAGRTGLMMRAAAMRLMHLGLTVHVVGETTTPAITAGDLLIAASGSGTTGSIVKAAEKAKAVGATVVALSTTTQSALAALANQVVVIPAAQKQDFHGNLSHQYAGSLFEQSVLFVTDAVFQSLWTLSNIPAETLWKRHANME